MEQKADIKIAQPLVETQSQAVVQESAPLVRYVDDTTFRRYLDKVVAAHRPLLAKLAE